MDLVMITDHFEESLILLKVIKNMEAQFYCTFTTLFFSGCFVHGLAGSNHATSKTG